ncbi:hypothetical protein [Archangium violaceum]|uniref:hypothetical protein n=1 Tax=Archangium violaceum TaxID=83451 RepID=UPI001EF0FF66|nr:hypothetical protein [Archangium violaceum]
MVTDEQRARIRRLYFAEHWKVGTIAAELGVHHDTVRGALEVERFVRTTARVRPTMLDPYRDLIAQTLAQHPKLRATRLYEMLRARGYQGSALQVRRYVARHRPVSSAEAYLRLSTLPGEQAQVDWAHFGRLRIGGAERPLCAFVLVLSRTNRPLRALRPGAVPGELPALPHPGLPGAGRGAALPVV